MADDQLERWRARPLASTLVSVVAFVTPFVLALAVSQAFVRLVSRPPDVSVWPWRMIAGGLAVVVAVVVEPFARRLLPLAALLQMSLLFPDRAPSRFGLSTKVGTVHDLNRLLAMDTSDHDAAQAARHVLALVAALSRHDRITRGHSERVRGYARLIAEELGLGPGDADRLQWAALLHDVGKLRVAPEILNKRGRLTSAEWEQIRKHPSAGADLIAPLADWLGPWAEAVAQHHERFDGSGYPNGLAGNEICLGGRVVAVIDAYDVMTASRSYKRALSSHHARAELVRCSRTQFDPDVVAAFLGISAGRMRFAAGPLAGVTQFALVSSVAQAGASVGATVSMGTLTALTAATVGGVLAASPAVATTPAAKTDPNTITMSKGTVSASQHAASLSATAATPNANDPGYGKATAAANGNGTGNGTGNGKGTGNTTGYGRATAAAAPNGNGTPTTTGTLNSNANANAGGGNANAGGGNANAGGGNPNAGGGNANAGGGNPNAGGGNANAGGGNPNAGGGNANAGGGNANAGGGNPNAGGGNANAGGGNANAGGGNPNAGGGNPNAGGGNPNAGGGNPNAGGGNPNAGGGNPNAGGGNPNAGGGNPNAGGGNAKGTTKP